MKKILNVYNLWIIQETSIIHTKITEHKYLNEHNRNQSGYYNCCDIIYNNTRIVHNNKLKTYYYLVLLPLNLFLRFWQRGLAKRLG